MEGAGILLVMLFLLMGLGGLALVVGEDTRRSRLTLDDAAARLGLRALGPERMAGQYRGHGVTVTRLRQDNRDPTIEVRCSVPLLLPQGFALSQTRPSAWREVAPGSPTVQLDPALAATWWCQSDDADGARELLADPEVRRLLIALDGRGVSIEGHVVTLTRIARFPEHVPAMLDVAVDLVHAMDAVTRGAWARVADRAGLTLEASDAGRRLIASTERRFEVRETGGPLKLDLRAEVWPPLPPGTHVTAPAGRGVSESLRDPVLDGHLTVRTSDVEALRERLVRDDVRGALLEVLNAHADSVLTSTELRVVAIGRSERRLATAIDAAQAVLRGLGAGAPG